MYPSGNFNRDRLREEMDLVKGWYGVAGWDLCFLKKKEIWRPSADVVSDHDYIFQLGLEKSKNMYS